MNTIEYVLQIFAVCQAAWVLGITIYIVAHYLRLAVVDKVIKTHVIFASISYLLLTMGTMITCLKSFYNFNSVWQILVIAGWLIGDWSLTILLFRVTKKYKLKKMSDAKLSSE